MYLQARREAAEAEAAAEAARLEAERRAAAEAARLEAERRAAAEAARLEAERRAAAAASSSNSIDIFGNGGKKLVDYPLLMPRFVLYRQSQERYEFKQCSFI